MKTNSILTNFLCDKYNIDLDDDFEIEEINANELIIPERIDLIAKIKYIEYKEKGYDLKYIKKLYAAHIEAFSSGTYTEPGNESKNSIDKYFDSFDLLIESIKKNGVDKSISVIPVGNNNAILDGAHRVAIAAYFDMKIPVIRFDNENIAVNYNAHYFKEELLDQGYIDYLVTEYCKLKKNIYIACVWPIANSLTNDSNLNSIISEHCKIVYENKIIINNQGLRNLLIQIYSSHSWIGNIENRFAGVHDKVQSCFHNDGELMVYVLEGGELEEILKLKKEVRDVFGIENHSIHITDNSSETLQMAHLLLNSNSVEFLNSGMPDYYIEFNRRLIKFKKRLNDFNLLSDDFIIDSSSSLALYGLRDASDIDFMTISNEFECIETQEISNHHQYVDLYETTIDDLVLNPNNYFVYNDLKFVTLNVLRKFKKNRNEKKDQLDVKLIDNVILGNKNLKMISLRFRNWIQKKKRNLRTIAKVAIIKVLKKIRLYKFIKRNISFFRKEKQ